MAIEFKTIDEQIRILEKRGLIFKERSSATELLLRSNYYDIVNGCSSFLQSDKDKFIEGATFEELYAIYMFDKDIKHTFFNRIGEAEAFLRTQIAYYFCEVHKGKYAYLDTSNFREDKQLEVARLLSDLARIINNNRYYDNAISHYLKKYDEVPLWVLVNFMEFGQLRIFYKLMLEKDKRKIADSICDLMEKYYLKKFQLTPSMLDSYLQNINDVRNMAAHDNRILKSTLRKDAKPNKYVVGDLKDVELNSVFHVYLTLRLFIPKQKYEDLDRALRNKATRLAKKIEKHKNLILSIIDSIGFTEEWFQKK
ncbi:Abi family protein [Lactococcus lactis subsp. lactis]|uniref:Abi family protein n=1 Tax=Lactococcus lactis TaxID=1358 RepID=UPI00223ABD26|nr:Abi family protein [Lactococcus lactis]MCT0017709.1 Abi family protein [Lactococcus lactis subsp. lactis]